MYVLTIEPYNFSVKDTICYSGSSQGIQVHIPCLFSMYPSSDGSGDIENRQGIWTCIPCEDRLTIIFYWSVLIKLSLESHSQTVMLFRIYFDYLLFLQTEILISEQIWGGGGRNLYKLILAYIFLAVIYFF